jgi:hypothetical protein
MVCVIGPLDVEQGDAIPNVSCGVSILSCGPVLGPPLLSFSLTMTYCLVVYAD